MAEFTNIQYIMHINPTMSIDLQYKVEFNTDYTTGKVNAKLTVRSNGLYSLPADTATNEFYQNSGYGKNSSGSYFSSTLKCYAALSTTAITDKPSNVSNIFIDLNEEGKDGQWSAGAGKVVDNKGNIVEVTNTLTDLSPSDVSSVRIYIIVECGLCSGGTYHINSLDLPDYYAIPSDTQIRIDNNTNSNCPKYDDKSGYGISSWGRYASLGDTIRIHYDADTNYLSGTEKVELVVREYKPGDPNADGYGYIILPIIGSYDGINYTGEVKVTSGAQTAGSFDLTLSSSEFKDSTQYYVYIRKVLSVDGGEFSTNWSGQLLRICTPPAINSLTARRTIINGNFDPGLEWTGLKSAYDTEWFTDNVSLIYKNGSNITTLYTTYDSTVNTDILCSQFINPEFNLTQHEIPRIELSDFLNSYDNSSETYYRVTRTNNITKRSVTKDVQVTIRFRPINTVDYIRIKKNGINYNNLSIYNDGSVYKAYWSYATGFWNYSTGESGYYPNGIASGYLVEISSSSFAIASPQTSEEYILENLPLIEDIEIKVTPYYEYSSTRYYGLPMSITINYYELIRTPTIIHPNSEFSSPSLSQVYWYGLGFRVVFQLPLDNYSESQVPEDYRYEDISVNINGTDYKLSTNQEAFSINSKDSATYRKVIAFRPDLISSINKIMPNYDIKIKVQSGIGSKKWGSYSDTIRVINSPILPSNINPDEDSIISYDTFNSIKTIISKMYNMYYGHYDDKMIVQDINEGSIIRMYRYKNLLSMLLDGDAYILDGNNTISDPNGGIYGIRSVTDNIEFDDQQKERDIKFHQYTPEFSEDDLYEIIDGIDTEGIFSPQDYTTVLKRIIESYTGLTFT